MMTTDYIIKAILYEANEFKKMDKETATASQIDYSLKTLKEVVDFFTKTVDYWKYTVELSDKTNSSYTDHVNWLNDNNINFWYCPGKYEKNSYSFLSEEDAMAFKLRFCNEHSNN